MVPPATVAGEVALEGEQPKTPLSDMLIVVLTAHNPQGANAAYAFVPGQFSLPMFPTGDYFVNVRGVPNGWYLKDVTLGGISVLHRLFRPGSIAGNGGLRVVLARDGGYVAIRVADADGKPVADRDVTIFPAQSASDGELADRIVTGFTDQNGMYQSAMMPPGKYYAIALGVEADRTPESMAKLRGAWNRATEVELSAGASKQLTLRPVEIE
jgi:hypothetical protein